MEQGILKQILHKLDKMELDITGMKADIAAIQKDTVRIPYVKQAVLEMGRDSQKMQKTLQKHKTILDILSVCSID